MKLRTRKFLAGLLSLGLLLQAASPLSALAADSSSAAHTLTVTVGDTTYNLTTSGETVSFDKTWPSGYPAVSYDEGFVFKGAFTGEEDLKIAGIAGTDAAENVTITSSGDYAVEPHLTMENVGNVTIEKNKNYKAALQDGADITCSGTLKIQNNHDGDTYQADFAVQGDLTAKAGSVEVLGTILGDATLDVSGGSVTLKCTNGTSVTNKLSVTGANGVTVEAYSQDGAIGNDGMIDHGNMNVAIAGKGKLVLNNCTGTVLVANSYRSGEAFYTSETEPLNVTGQNAVYHVRKKSGDWKVSNDPQKECKEYNYLKIEFGGQTQPTTHTLTLKNAKAYTDAECTTELSNATSANGTTTYKVENGKELTIKAIAPGEHYHFTGWTERNSKDEVLTLNVTENTTLTANWAEMHQIYIDGTLYKYNDGTEYFAPGKTVAIKAAAPARDTLDIGYVFGKWEKAENSADFTYGTIAGQQCNEKTDLTYIVMPAGDVRLKTNWIKYYSLTTDNCKLEGNHQSYPAGEEITITAQETVTGDAGSTQKLREIVVAPKEGYTGEEIKATGSDGTYTFTMPAYPAVVTAKYEDKAVKTTHTLTLTNAKAYTDDTYQTPLEPTTEGGNEYSVEEGTMVYLKTEQPEEEARWGCYWYSETNLLDFGLDTDDLHSKTISFEMPAKNMELEVKWYKLYDITANNKPYVFMDGTSDISKGWILALSCEKVAGYDQDTGYSAILWEKDAGSADFEFIDSTNENSGFPHIHVTSEGDVKLKVTFTESGYYKVIPDNTCELVKAGENDDGFYETGKTVTIKAADAEQVLNGIKVTTKKDGTVISATKQEDGSFTFTMPSSPVYVTAETDAPIPEPGVPGDDDFTGGDSGAGGAVAAVIVGGAAVWGGYEIATRVILHNILPEGAEIPANRGQLALLVWNTAGRPEPVNTPAFADVADADTAKAAQWCVEQGLMDAKSESTFKPEGWMPKFKTIEVWEKAFPKQ